jgi:hypothetical protein
MLVLRDRAINYHPQSGDLSELPRGGRLFEEPPKGGKPKTVQNLSFQDHP